MTNDKHWKLPESPQKDVPAALSDMNPVVAQLLIDRGLTDQDKIQAFFEPDYARDLHDPFLFTDMEVATKRILQAIEKNEHIVVYGDYDADGVTASAIMVQALGQLGAEVDVYIPFRETEGYGMNQTAVESLAKDGAQLIITVDCGVANADEIAWLQENNIDVIVTDHHQQPLKLPKAFAIINPSLEKEPYPWQKLAGSGVAFKLVQALLLKHADYKVKQLNIEQEKWLLDLVAIGTVADMMPLLDENRALVYFGLKVLRQTKRLGLQKLFKTMNNRNGELNERTIGFQIAPRLNAAGRLNHASTAYELLLSDDQSRVSELADELEATNRERQRLTEEVSTAALDQIGEVKDQKLLVAVGKGWPTGLVGLVAGRIADRFYRPSLVISEFKGDIIGSGRSIAGFDITQALKACDKYLSRYGGHAQACGFTLKDKGQLKPFIKKITQLADKQLDSSKLIKSIQVDAEVEMSQIDWKLWKLLEKFAPFGEGNAKPKFVSRKFIVEQAQTMGKDNSHLRLSASQGTKTYKFVGFGRGADAPNLQPGQTIDIVFDVDVNEWNGKKELQFKIVDWKNAK